ncbi:flavin reductase family protein [Nocardia fluminea]|uniref:flavin reductase family protein n=1 Tax=Nocardia fluminea TaxID=134984 RepID=UPI003D147EC9
MLLASDQSRRPSPQRCLELYRRLAAGVTVVTAQSSAGPMGLTASSVTSLSLHPPMLLAGLKVGSGTLAAIERSHMFGIQLLSEDQAGAAQAFSTPTGTRFAGLDHEYVFGVPVLREVLGWSVCMLVDARRYGDHVLVIGEVAAVNTSEGRPLMWHNGQLTRLDTAAHGAQ